MKLHHVIFIITPLIAVPAYAAKNVHMDISGATQSDNAQQARRSLASGKPFQARQRQPVKSDPGQGIRAPGVIPRRTTPEIKSKKKHSPGLLAVEREMKESGEKGGTGDINIGIGE